MNAPRIAVVVPWSGRRDLAPVLRSIGRAGLEAGDEVVVVRDGTLDPDLRVAGRDAILELATPGAIVRVGNTGTDAPTGDYGSKARTIGQRLAKADWIVFLDSDDVLTPTAFQTWRGALAAGAAWDDGRAVPLHFRVVVNNGTVVHSDHVLRVGNASTLGIMVPREIAQAVAWPAFRYENDFDFLSAACAFVNRGAPVFVDCPPVAVARWAEGDGRLDTWGVDLSERVPD